MIDDNSINLCMCSMRLTLRLSISPGGVKVQGDGHKEREYILKVKKYRPYKKEPMKFYLN